MDVPRTELMECQAQLAAARAEIAALHTRADAAESALEAMGERFEMLSQMLSDSASSTVVRPNGELVREWYIDRLLCTYGYTFDDIDTLDKWRIIVHPEDRPQFDEKVRRFSRDGRIDNEARIVTRSGELRWISHRARVVIDKRDGMPRIVCAVTDITERKLAEQALHSSEEQLRQSQKMESIGQLAGGMAHDINNLLTPILAFSQLLLGASPDQPTSRRYLSEIHDAAVRIGDLVRQLLGFSRKQTFEPRLVDLRTVVTGVDKMLRRTVQGNIEIKAHMPSEALMVRADVMQLEQVLLNLAVNAKDAMPHGGVLSIDAATVEVEQAHVPLEPTRTTRLVRLSVRDTGPGIDPSLLQRVFEPFFTTKPVGQGTGLGLSMVYGIAKQHGGHVQASNAPSGGALIEVFLPMASEADVALAR